MKAQRLLAFILLLTLTVLSTPVMAGQYVTIANNGFETGDKTGWTANSGEVIKDATEAPEGEHYLSVTTASYVTTPKVPVEAGKTYSIRFYYKAGATVSYWARAYDSSDKTTMNKEFGFNSTSGEWKLYQEVFTMPENSVSVAFQFRTYSSTSEFGLDNFCVILEDGTNSEELSGGDFEATDLTGFSVTGEAALDTDKKHGGNASLKLTNTASIAKKCYIPGGKVGYVSAYFYPESLPTGENEGAKLSVLQGNTVLYETSFFTKSDTYWKKMLICIPKTFAGGFATVKVELVGNGTVYFDDLSVKNTDDLILNGDLEGLKSDTEIAGNYVLGSAAAAEIAEDGNAYKVIHTSAWSSTNYIKIPVSYNTSNLYCLSFSYKCANNYSPYINVEEANNAAGEGRTDGHLDNAMKANEWNEYKYYYTVTYTSGNIWLCNRGSSPVTYDNIKLEVVGKKNQRNETLKLSENSNLEPGDTVEACYSEHSLDYTAEGRSVTMIFGLYKIVDGENLLCDVKVKNGKAPKASYLSATHGTAGYAPRGKAPLELKAELTVPGGEGEYYVKAFAIDGEKLIPYVDDIILN